MPKLPFIPKSTTYLEPGHYWSIPLSNGNFACGVVLQLDYIHGKRDSRSFLCGLVDWTGPDIPTQNDIVECEVIEHGGAHIKTISENNGEILGKIVWEDSSLEIPLTLSESPGRNCRIQKGFDIFDIATPEQQKNLKVFSTWGYRVIVLQAEKHFVKATQQSHAAGLR